MSEETQPRQVADDPPPFLGRWSRVYGVVVVYLFGLIVLFWVFGKAFTP